MQLGYYLTSFLQSAKSMRIDIVKATHRAEATEKKASKVKKYCGTNYTNTNLLKNLSYGIRIPNFRIIIINTNAARGKEKIK